MGGATSAIKIVVYSPLSSVSLSVPVIIVQARQIKKEENNSPSTKGRIDKHKKSCLSHLTKFYQNESHSSLFRVKILLITSYCNSNVMTENCIVTILFRYGGNSLTSVSFILSLSLLLFSLCEDTSISLS